MGRKIPRLVSTTLNNSISPLQAQSLLKSYRIRPRKALGQNFLVNAGARQLIVDAADLTTSDVVLEIGPGLGALTEALAQAAERVVSIELDALLYRILQDILKGFENVVLVQGDILTIEIGSLGLEPGYIVVANIPYNITSAVVRHIMESEIPAARAVLTVQKEVAERMVANPGEMNLLALSVQVFGAASIQAHISPGSFYPVPSVDSAVVRVDMYAREDLDHQLLNTLFTLARAGFAQKRKQLKNSIAHGLPIDKTGSEDLLRSCGVEPTERAQGLDVETWFRLARAYQELEDN